MTVVRIPGQSPISNNRRRMVRVPLTDDMVPESPGANEERVKGAESGESECALVVNGRGALIVSIVLDENGLQ
jgi:hypothetical protein